jgi:hypothetical protein
MFRNSLGYKNEKKCVWVKISVPKKKHDFMAFSYEMYNM